MRVRVSVLFVFASLVLLAMLAWAGQAGAASRVAGLGRPGAVKPQVACGGYFTVALKSDGTLWVWGDNSEGELGQGASGGYVASPTQVGADTHWVAVACGEYHAVALKSDGTLWAWGDNSFGELGQGTSGGYSTSPTQVGTDTHWISVACGKYFTVALKSDGTLWAWGYNYDGELGQGTFGSNYYTSPIQVGADTQWVAVACGYSHTVALKSDGTMWAWGDNSAGEIGQGTTSTNYKSPMQVGTDTHWVSVSCGYLTTVALKSDGTLWAWGVDNYGQLGQGASGGYVASPAQVGADTHWVALSCGYDHTVALKSDGTLWAWGDNQSGELGQGTSGGYGVSPTQVGTDSHWVAAVGGPIFTVALKSDGTLWTWGYNGYGELGQGNTTTCTSPAAVVASGTGAGWSAHTLRLAVGSETTCAVKANGALLSWGCNASGELGRGTVLNGLTPAPMGTDNAWVSVASGMTTTAGDPNFTLAVKSDGTLWAWGNNSDGELGQGAAGGVSTTPEQVGTGSTWVAVAAGYESAYALQSNGTLWAWGLNNFGQLGLGNFSSSTSPTQVGTSNTWVALAAGDKFALALQSNGTLWSWGYDSNGQLGLGNTTNYTSPTQVGTATNWTAISCGDAHSLALQSNGTLWSWGANASGQLGLGNQSTGPTSPTQVTALSGVVAIAAGRVHSAALLSNGILCAWGDDSSGQLGQGDYTVRSTPTQVIINKTTYPSATDNAWVSLGCGNSDIVAANSSGGLWAWGYNGYGQLGVGDTTLRNVATSVTSLSDTLAPGFTMPLGSSSHPSQSTWYANNTPVFTWAESDVSGVAGYSYVFDQSPGTVPPASVGYSLAGYSPGAVADGTWYLHVRSVDGAGNWSATTTFQVNVDTTPPSGALQISNGDLVAARGVTLSLAENDLTTVVMQVRNAGADWPQTWSSFGAQVPWTVSSGDGDKTIQVRYEDQAGNISPTYSATTTLDTTPPTGWLIVAADATAVDTTATSVETWATDMDGPVQMRLRNGGDAWPSSWTLVTGDTLQAWALPTGDGAKTVDVEYEDAAGNISLIRESVILDTTAPTGDLAVDGGAVGTQSTAATLSLDVSDANAPIDMRLRDATGSWGDWQPFSDSESWTLPAGDGSKTVQVQYRDIAGNISPAIGSTIALDTVAPVTTDNAGSVWHAGPWALTLTPSDPPAGDGSHSGMVGGAAQTQYSLDGGATWQTGTSVAFPRWKRGGGSGTYPVLYQSTDAAGNREKIESTTVRIDNSLPTASATLTVPGNPATVTLTARDPDSGVNCVWYSLDGGAWIQASYPSSGGVQVNVSGLGAHTMDYYAVDNAGNPQSGYAVVTVTVTAGGSHINARLARYHRQPRPRRFGQTRRG